MPRLPTLSGRDVVRVFQHFGWQVLRQSSSLSSWYGRDRRPPYPFPITEKSPRALSEV
jgi:hypothetical protein